MSTESTLANLLTGEEFRAGSVGNIAIVCWQKKPTKRAVLSIETLFDRVLSSTSARCAFFVIVERDLAPPDAEARDAFADAMKRRADRIFGSCLVIEGTGIKSAAVRAVTTAISLLGDLNPTPQVSATVDAAAASLQVLATSSHADMPSAAALVAACKALRG